MSTHPTPGSDPTPPDPPATLPMSGWLARSHRWQTLLAALVAGLAALIAALIANSDRSPLASDSGTPSVSITSVAKSLKSVPFAGDLEIVTVTGEFKNLQQGWAVFAMARQEGSSIAGSEWIVERAWVDSERETWLAEFRSAPLTGNIRWSAVLARQSGEPCPPNNECADSDVDSHTREDLALNGPGSSFVEAVTDPTGFEVTSPQ
jgi:hypothetical protein